MCRVKGQQLQPNPVPDSAAEAEVPYLFRSPSLPYLSRQVRAWSECQLCSPSLPPSFSPTSLLPYLCRQARAWSECQLCSPSLPPSLFLSYLPPSLPPCLCRQARAWPVCQLLITKKSLETCQTVLLRTWSFWLGTLAGNETRLGMRPGWEWTRLGMRPGWEWTRLGMRPDWE